MERKFQIILKNLRLKRGWTQSELGEKIGGDQPEISRYELGLRFPSRDRLLALAQALEIPMGMLTGDEEARAPVAVHFRSESLADQVVPTDRKSELLDVPLVDDAVAIRGGHIRGQEIKDWVLILHSQLGNRTNHDLVCVYVRDAAMEPLLSAGAIACLDRDEKPVDDESLLPDAIYAVRIKEDELVLRQLSVKADSLVLIPANLDRKTFQVLHTDRWPQSGIVIGRVIWTGVSLIR
ncbi:MAG TPA: LexA family transcriptional regulator [Candidatus Deferrimicrobiaceae bacterium]|jgi:transcriptional regulator with XRE-family HTH domain